MYNNGCWLCPQTAEIKLNCGAAPDRLLADEEDTSTLVPIRGYGFMGSGCYMAVNINETD